jgi:hypothetical protein
LKHINSPKNRGKEGREPKEGKKSSEYLLKGVSKRRKTKPGDNDYFLPIKKVQKSLSTKKNNSQSKLKMHI